MTQKYLSFLNSNISYYRFGTGSRIVFAFHGYSNDSRIFDVLRPYLQTDYTFIAIDLPIHGGTRWRNGLLTPDKLKKIIDSIILQENLPNEYFLLGFSLGGRIAMSFYQDFPAQIKELILLAPDGLYKAGWYRFIAQSYIGTRITTYLLKRPQMALAFLEWCKKNRLINSHVYIYAQGLLNSKRESTLLYARWNFMRKMRPNLYKLCKAVLKYRTPVKLVFGRGDTITPEHNGDYLAEHAAPYVQFQEWEAGHLLLKEKYLTQLVALFK